MSDTFKKQVKEHVLLMLGSPTVNIPLADDKINAVITAAFKEVSGYVEEEHDLFLNFWKQGAYLYADLVCCKMTGDHHQYDRRTIEEALSEWRSNMFWAGKDDDDGEDWKNTPKSPADSIGSQE